MSLGLHQNLRTKLIGDLAQVLPQLKVTRGIAVSSASIPLLANLNTSLPGHGEIRDKLTAWVSDQPLSDFVVGYINDALMGDAYVDGSLAPLTELTGWDDSSAKATRIIEDFERLPNIYLVSISAPTGMEEFLQTIDGQMRLANRARFALADDDFAKQHPVTTGDKVRDKSIWEHSLLTMFSSPDKNYEWKGAYLQIIKQGFIGRFVETATSHEVVGDFKSLWGVQLALGIAKRRSLWSAYPVKKKLIIHQSKDKNLCLQMRLELDAATSTLAEQIAFNDWMPEGHSQETKANVYQLYFNEVDLIFGVSEEASRLRLASRWLFDSYATDNELLAYIQAMVCLEIILGDTSIIGEIGLGELLRNRCAYLIGKTSVERAEILRDFKEIYDVRSHIVHRGKNRMNARERGLYANLVWYCQRCIKEEIELLKKTKEEVDRTENKS